MHGYYDPDVASDADPDLSFGIQLERCGLHRIYKSNGDPDVSPDLSNRLYA